MISNRNQLEVFFNFWADFESFFDEKSPFSKKHDFSFHDIFESISISFGNRPIYNTTFVVLGKLI